MFLSSPLCVEKQMLINSLHHNVTLHSWQHNTIRMVCKQNYVMRLELNKYDVLETRNKYI